MHILKYFTHSKHKLSSSADLAPEKLNKIFELRKAETSHATNMAAPFAGVQAQNYISAAPPAANPPIAEVFRPPVSASKIGEVSEIAPETPVGCQAARPSEEQQQRREEGARPAEDWISKVVEHLWPYIRQTTQDIAWGTVPPILEQSRPSWVHSLKLVKFELGAKEPDLRCVRIVDEESLVDDVFVQVDIEWQSKQDVEIELQVMGNDIYSLVPNLIEDQLAKLLTMRVGVEDTSVKGTLQLALRPLLHRIPIVGAVQVAFTQLPEFDFTPTVTGGPMGSSLSALMPSIKSWLKTTVQEAIWMPYVLPDHYFNQLDPAAPDIQRPVGMLQCKVVEAKGVPRMDLFGGSDTFVEAYVRHTQRHKTKIVKGKRPKWDEEFLMPVHSPEHQRLRFALWDYDDFSPNDEIGRCEVSLSELEENRWHDLWLNVTSASEEEQQDAKREDSAMHYTKGGRVLHVLAKPASHSVAKCSLRVRLQWRKWTDPEAEFIGQAMQRGVHRALQGAQIDPGLKALMLSGTVQVDVRECRGLGVHGLIWKPSVKAVVCVGELEPVESQPFKVSRHGNADFSGSLMEINIDGELTTKSDIEVTVLLQEVGFLSGSDIVGTMSFPLQEVIRAGNKGGKMGLEEGGSCSLEVRWIGTFC